MNPDIYPRGATNANWFALFNALSFQITLGSPMILYAKSLGASATVLGIIASLAPLLTIAQIPAAHFLQRVGYRRMVLAGWGSRTIFIFALVPLPLVTFLPEATKIAIVLFILFLFNLLRGIASGAWLPWITDLIPESVRGRFMSRDQIFLHFGSLLSLGISAAVLGKEAAGWQFSAVFLLSAITGTSAVWFVRRIPDVEPGEQLVKSTTRVPWREIVTFPPFLKLVIFNVLFLLSIGSLGVFNVAFMKVRLGLGENVILYLTTAYFAGALLALPQVGRFLDAFGNKPMLLVSMALWWTHVAAWLALGLGLLPGVWWVIALVSFFGGFAGASFNVANIRLVMATMPPLGRSHFFAFFSVISSLALGFTPVIWGVVLDAVGDFEALAGGLTWNRYSIYFASILLLCTVTTVFTAALHETTEKAGPRAAPDAVFAGQLRRILRLWQR